MKNSHLPIITGMDEDVYCPVSCPLFKGCHSCGETMDEGLTNIREVIDICPGGTKSQGTRTSLRDSMELQVVRNAETSCN